MLWEAASPPTKRKRKSQNPRKSDAHQCAIRYSQAERTSVAKLKDSEGYGLSQPTGPLRLNLY